MGFSMLRFWQWVFYGSPALVLVVKSGHFIGPFFMAWVGLFFYRQAQIKTPLLEPAIVRSWRWLLGGFAVFVLVGVGLGLFHGNHAGHYELYVPFVLFPAMAWLIRAGQWSAAPWLVAVAVGAVSAFSVAFYQSMVLGIGRAIGAAGNPIPFGNTAIVLAAICGVAAVMYPFVGPYSKLARALMWLGAIAGAGASLLSGSKGGWMSLFIIGITISYLSTQHWAAWCRHVAAGAVVFALVVAGALAPAHVVKDRIVSGLAGGWHWLQTGQVTEDSVSMRFEIWRIGAMVVAEKPWFGHGSVGAHERWDDLAAQAPSHAELAQLYGSTKFISSDNELLGALQGGGVVGALAVFAAYLCVWMAFWRWRKHSDAQIKTLATTGMLMVPLYLEFGLSVSVFGINVFRSVYVVLAVSLLALITVRLHHMRQPT
jgi:O-antigen ligase